MSRIHIVYTRFIRWLARTEIEDMARTIGELRKERAVLAFRLQEAMRDKQARGDEISVRERDGNGRT
jgi:hypothetical protein